MNAEEEIFKYIEEKYNHILINPDNIDIYLSNFKEEKRDLYDYRLLEDKRILITGISGFVGSNLVEKFIEMKKSKEINLDIYGFVRRQSVPLLTNIRDFIGEIELKEGNMIDSSSIEQAIKDVEPHYIFHLAAQSFVPTSFLAPTECIQTNIQGTLNLLESIRKIDFDLINMHVACSSEEYGLVNLDEIPINENNPFRPQSPYAISKVSTEHYSLAYYRAYGIPVAITRGFNHTGPKRGSKFATSVICSQIARAIRTGESEIVLGNPKPIRDFTDIGDILQGYLLVITKGEKGSVYNIGHGYGISIENLLKLTANLFDINYTLKIDKERFRPAEVNVLICDYSKAKNELGYYPQIPITHTMKNIVNYYLKDDLYSKVL